jgi:hypothetical protein
MTQKSAHEPEDLNWMDIAESDATNEVRHSRGRLPFIVAALALVAVGGSTLFAQTNNPGPSQVEPTSAVATALPSANQPAVGQEVSSTPPVVSGGVPTIAPVAGGGRYDDDEDDDEHDDEHDDEDDDDDD